MFAIALTCLTTMALWQGFYGEVGGCEISRAESGNQSADLSRWQMRLPIEIEKPERSTTQPLRVAWLGQDICIDFN